MEHIDIAGAGKDVDKPIKRRLAWAIRGLLSISLAAVIGLIITKVAERVWPNVEVAYEDNSFDRAVLSYHDFGARLTYVFDGMPMDNISMTRVRLYNQSSEALSDLDIIFRFPEGTPQPLFQLINYPGEHARYWFEWGDEKDIPSVRNTNAVEHVVKARVFNVSIFNEPNVTISFFFPTPKAPRFDLATRRAGVEFVKFKSTEEGPNYWFFFGFGWLFTIAIMALFFAGIFWAVSKFDDYIKRRMSIAYGRVVAKAMRRYFSEAPGIRFGDIVEIAIRAYVHNLYRFSWREKHDGEIAIPPVPTAEEVAKAKAELPADNS